MMTKRQARKRVVEALGQVELFAHCDDAALLRIDQLCTEICMEPGRRLIEAGRVGREFFVILEGAATVSHEGEVVGTVGPGSFVGELSLLDHIPRNATVTADTPLRVLVLNAGEFHSLLHEADSVREAIERAAAERRRPATENTVTS